MDRIEIHVTDGQGKQIPTTQDGRGEGNSSEPESWIVQVKQRYKSGEGPYKNRQTSQDASIYRVPESMRSTNPKAYDPLVVSLGPYHHKEHLSAMDDRKLQAVHSTLEMLRDMTMACLITKISNLEAQIRNIYEDSAIDWDSQTLIWMLTMDACFIIDFLRKPMVKDNTKSREILADILKLENQIPFCILIEILELEFKEVQDAQKFLAKRLTDFSYFRGFPFTELQTDGDNPKAYNDIFGRLIREKNPRHLLDLCREVIVDVLHDSATANTDECCADTAKCGASSWLANPNGNDSNCGAFSWPCISPCLFQSTVLRKMPSEEKLRKAGIKCKPIHQGNVHFEKKNFCRSRLFLHQITVDNSTEIFLRNLMAFEECQREHTIPTKATISLQVLLMDNLIESKEDVALLVKQNIIRNSLGSDDEVATLFNNVCSGITYENTEIQQVLVEVNKHYNFMLNVWRRQLKEEHFSTPCYVVSFLAAVFLLVLTTIQTFKK